MTTTVPSAHDLRALLERAARDDVEAFGDFVSATAAKAAELLRVLGCAEERSEALLLGCYREAWEERGRFAGSGLSPRAWLLVRVRDTVARQRDLRAVA
jgi:hypothetical protein